MASVSQMRMGLPERMNSFTKLYQNTLQDYFRTIDDRLCVEGLLTDIDPTIANLTYMVSKAIAIHGHKAYDRLAMIFPYQGVVKLTPEFNKSPAGRALSPYFKRTGYQCFVERDDALLIWPATSRKDRAAIRKEKKRVWDIASRHLRKHRSYPCGCGPGESCLK